MKNWIKLQTDSILQVPFQKYLKDFVFVVNSERFETSSFVADLISPIISSRHLIDPTLSEFTINTQTHGDFKKILNLINFQQQEINENEFSFIIEVYEQLGIEKVDTNITTDDELTNDNILDHIKIHQAHCHFFRRQLKNEIEYFASHFYELKEKFIEYIRGKSFDLSDVVVESIISSDKLVLDTENDLLEVINELYLKNNEFSKFYEFVDFKNVEQEAICKFTEIFDIKDLTTSSWNSVCDRLKVKIMDDNQNSDQNKPSKHECRKPKYFIEIADKQNEFDGLMNYLRKNSNIKDEISITNSSYGGGKDPFDLVKYEDKKCYYETSSNDSNSWICFEFKNHKIIPSSYIIRSYYTDGNWHLKSWNIEGSNDNTNWVILDKQQDNSLLNGGNNVHLFPISNNSQSFKYLRIHLTGQNWRNNYGLMMNSIEFYGKLI